MVDNAKVEVRGASEAFRDITLVVRRIDASTDKTLETVARQVQTLVASRVPHVTGRLSRSVETLAVQGGAAVGFNTTDAPYAGWIEFGGAGRPYVSEGRTLFPTAQEETESVRSALENNAEKEIRSFPWSKPK